VSIPEENPGKLFEPLFTIKTKRNAVEQRIEGCGLVRMSSYGG
jgi:hypothetical protein